MSTDKESKENKCVKEEMGRWKAGKLHSGAGKGGKEGPVVKSQEQAIAIALSVCGKSNHAETFQTLGFSEEASRKAAEMLTKRPNWENQFRNGETLIQLPKENKTTLAPTLPGMDVDNRAGKQPGDQGKHAKHHSQGLTGITVPKGNPQQGPRSRSDRKGLAAF